MRLKGERRKWRTLPVEKVDERIRLVGLRDIEEAISREKDETRKVSGF